MVDGRGRRRRGLRARARPALVGRRRAAAPGPASRCFARRRCQVSDVSPARGRVTSRTPRCRRLGRARPARRLPRAHPALLAHPGRTATSGPTCSSPRAAVDLAAEPELALHDMAALDVIVDEAGGRFTSLDGHAGPDRRQRARHQRPAARPGAGVHRVAARRPGEHDHAGGAAQVHDLSARRQRMAAEHAEDVGGDDD